MQSENLEAIVLRTNSAILELREQVARILSKEQRVTAALGSLKRRTLACISTFDRDQYKSTDQRLRIRALADELQIFDKLGYDTGLPGAQFIIAVGELLEGRNQSALDHFQRFINEVDPGDPNLANAHYLSAMISYNRRDFSAAIAHFDAAFTLSPQDKVDWQSKIYVGELTHFLRRPRNEIEKAFGDVEDALRLSQETSQTAALRATLYLKWGNCYVDILDLEPAQSNPLISNQLAIGLYKRARASLPTYTQPDSLLPVVIDYSLAQALLIARSIDMDLSMTPAELIFEVFNRLRRIVLTKREEIILAQSYFMLGTCAYYSEHIPNEIGEIYLEYARTQTLTVPSDICFYSCITKELLGRDSFVRQIDHYASRLQRNFDRG